MMQSNPLAASAFRRRFLSGDPLLGTFIKTPTGHATEILGDVGFDFVVIDEEHAPFDRGSIDVAILAARAANIAAIVRIADASPAKILAPLDDGAQGLLVPHVSSAEKAREIAAACRYRGGRRGFSNSPRAGDYGRLGIWDHVDAQDDLVTFIAMIEDPEALECLDEIMAVDGLDGVFIGRGDLTVALGSPGMESDETMKAATTIAQAAARAGKPVCMMAADGTDVDRLSSLLGANAFIISSDQGLMRQRAAALLTDFRATQLATKS